MTTETSFEKLCGLFVSSLLDKAHAFGGGSLSAFQRSRLGEAMTSDIRKLGDMVFPAARQPLMSSAAKDVADRLGYNLLNETWHSQKRIDGYKTFTYEHLFPVRQIRQALGGVTTYGEAMDVLGEMLWVAWITKEEDARLRAMGLTSFREDPYFDYESAGIELVVQEIEGQSQDDQVESRMKAVLEMVGVLHRRGFERLRIVPGFSGSGHHWRCSIAPDGNVEPEPSLAGIDRIADHDGPVITWTNANPRVFGDPKASLMKAEELADTFARRFPTVLNLARGSDSAYAGWYASIVLLAHHGEFPVFYADYLTIEDGRTPLVSRAPASSSSLPLPPPILRSQRAMSPLAKRMTWKPGDVTVTPPPPGDSATNSV